MNRGLQDLNRISQMTYKNTNCSKATNEPKDNLINHELNPGHPKFNWCNKNY